VAIDSFDGTYRFLSNFKSVNVEFDGIVYPSTENAYQAAKADDPALRSRFLTCTAGQAKRLGREITLRSDWDDVKYGIMRDLLYAKFEDVVLREKLKSTYPQELIEGNTWGDTYWGVCRGIGQNNLGKLLMQVRLACILSDAHSIGFVGSRACTKNQLDRLGSVAGWAAITDSLGVSGGCVGADQKAANKYLEYGKAENFHIHMPWPQYNSKHQVIKGCTWDCWKPGNVLTQAVSEALVPKELRDEALWLAELHDAYRTKNYPYMMGRNALIVMHSDVLVYAIAGDSAGTTHDINIAADIGVPSINVDTTWEQLWPFLIREKARLA
jgi:ribA/ribD-fused uncharacterized protein